MLCRHASKHSLVAFVAGGGSLRDCPTGYSDYRGAGVNVFDALWVASPSFPSSRRTGKGQAEILSALEGLVSSGVRFFRFFASLYGSDQAIWVQSPENFWAAFDWLIENVERLGLYCVPSLGYEWELVARALGHNDTKNDLVRSPTSFSRKLAYSYFHEVTARYRDRTAILVIRWNPTPWSNPVFLLSPFFCEACQRPHSYSAIRPGSVQTNEVLGARERARPQRQPAATTLREARAMLWHCRPRRICR